jgi:NAD(P)-dependent dehydrogenase (short-subunit alcohol dehydrogenase family)
MSGLSLQGNSMLVTGGGSGLGRAIVERFIAEGATVTILDRSQHALDSLRAEFGDRIATAYGDVRSLADNRATVDLAIERFGKLDTFIGNAGIWDYSIPLLDIPDDAIDAAFDEVFAINTKGYLLGVKAAAPALVRSRGSVVLTLSNAAYHTGGGGVLYTASKHAGVGVVRQLAYEMAPFVRVNAVAPGAVSSDLRGPKALDQQDRSIQDIPLEQYVKQSNPLGRLPSASEYTGAYVMLASSANAATITGTVVQSDGGLGIRGLSGPAGGLDLWKRFGK